MSESSSSPKKRAPRKAVRKTATKAAVKKTTTRTKTSTTSTRKAPTPIAAATEQRKQAQVTMLIGAFLFVVSIASGITIGVMADGEIIVDEKIAAQRETASAEQLDALDKMARTETQNKRPNAGLTLADNQPANRPRSAPVDTASTTDDGTGTSTDEAATSTEAIASEETASDTSEATTEGEVVGVETATETEAAAAPDTPTEDESAS